MTFALAESDLFDGILGLPLHPLVVHVVVVVLPVSAFVLILLIVIPRLRARFATVTVIGVLVGSAATLVAKESGEALERHVGDPGVHAQYGDWATISAGVLVVVTLVWYVLQRLAGTPGARRALLNLVGAVTVLAAATSIGLVVLVGHSGAERVWNGTLNQTAAASAPVSPTASVTTSPSSTTSTSTAPTSPSATQSTSSAGSYTLAQVAVHSGRSSCWTAINGSVYDVTAWINQHPGGPDRILGLCGHDGSQAFNDQHAGESRPAQELAQFRIGALAG